MPFLTSSFVFTLAAFAKKIFIPYDRVLGDSFVRGKVTAVEISIKRITLESGKQVSGRASSSRLLKSFRYNEDDPAVKCNFLIIFKYLFFE